MKKFCLRANSLPLFKRTSISISTNSNERKKLSYYSFFATQPALWSFGKERIFRKESHSRKLFLIGRERVNMILALVLPRRTFWSFSFGTLLVSGPTPRLLLQWWEQPQHSGVNMNKSSLPKCLSKSLVVDPSGVTFVTLDVVHAVIFSLSKSTTLYVVDLWGDRCGREVPHFDSRPVSISDPRVGMTP